MRFIREADDNGKCPSFCLDYREDKESGFSFFFEDLLIANGFVTGRCGEWDSEKNTFIVSKMADIRNVEMARELLALDDLEISLGAIKNAINVCVDKESKEAMLPIAEKLAAKVEKAKKEFNEKWN